MGEKIIITTKSFLPSPLSPVLPWCRSKLKERKDKSLEQVLKEWGLSPLHRDLFISYFQEEIPYRTEEFSFSEKEYDRRLIYQSLWLIFYSLIQEEEIKEVHLLIEEDYSYNNKKFMTFLEKETRELSLVLKIVFKGQIIVWDGFSHIPAYQADPSLSEWTHFRKAMTFQAFGDYLIACQLCEGLYQKARRGKLGLNIQQRAALFTAYGKSAFHLQQGDLALTIFNSLMNLGKAWENSEYISEAYRLTGIVFHKNGYQKAALRFFRKSLDESGKSGLAILRFRTLFTFILLVGPDRLSPEEEEEALEIVQSREMESSEATLQLYRKNPDFDRVFEIIEKTGDRLLLSETYYRRAMLAINKYGTKTEKDLKNSLRIGQELDNSRIITRANNSLGCLFLKRGDYKAGFYQYRKALEGYFKDESYGDMAQVYYQLALLSLLVFKPDFCLSYLKSSQYILERLIRRQPELEERNKILLFFARLQSTGKIPALPMDQVHYDSNEPAYEMLTFFLDIHKKEEEEILEKMESRAPLLSYYKGGNLCLLLLAIRCRPGKSNLLLIQKLGEYSASKGEMDIIVDLVQKGESVFPYRCHWLKEPIVKELVSTSLKQYRRLEQLKRKMHEINLLSAIQTIFSQTSEREALLFQTMERLLTSFLVNRISYYEKLEDSFRLAYHSSTFDEQPDRSLLNDYLDCSRPEDRYESHTIGGALCIPVMTENHLEGIIIGQMEESSLNAEENDIQFFTILASQFGSALEHIKQRELIVMKNRQLEEINRELTKTTLTDPLTGIGNRMQLDVMMRDFSQRYGGNREGDNFCLLFIDLDFFKIYNDTYGHALGDKLLNRFTQLMKAACRERDGLFRYGGDEFILLLAGISSEQALPIANRLLESMEEHKGFTELITEAGHEGSLVSRDKWLSCSIGISDFIKAGRDLENLLEQADKAVYQAKEQGKNRWIIYKEGDRNE